LHERRRYPRFVLRRRAWCEGDRFTIFLRTVDASADGLQIRTSIPPPPGTKLRVSIDEPGHGRVVVEAEVVWARAGAAGRGGMGLRIVSFVEGAPVWERLVGGGSTGEPA
jgi:hypothetical protein